MHPYGDHKFSLAIEVMYGAKIGEKIFWGYVYQKKGEIYKGGFPTSPLFPLGVYGCHTWNNDRYRSFPRCYVWMGFSPFFPLLFPQKQNKKKKGNNKKMAFPFPSLSFPLFPP